MKKYTELIVFEPQVIDSWNYENSVKKVKTYFLKWKNLTQDILDELAAARENLSQKRRKCDVSQTWTSYCEEIGIDRRTVHRWLTAHTKKLVHVSQSSGESEWNTPSEYIESARTLMDSIDVDPASNEQAQKLINADVYYTKETNGLDKSWAGNVWMNPPYSQPIVKYFCNTLVDKFKSGEINQACVLINNATETRFFQEMVKMCMGICFIKGRVKFIDKEENATGAPLQGQVIIYFGKKREQFKNIFSKFGEILWNEEK